MSSNILDPVVAYSVVYKVCNVWCDQIILCRPFVPTTYFVLLGFCYFGMMRRKVTPKNHKPLSHSIVANEP